MNKPRGMCQYCGREVMEDDIAAYRVTGWEVERSAGGANRILGREREPNLIVHAVCAERYVKRGDQMSLV